MHGMDDYERFASTSFLQLGDMQVGALLGIF